MNDLKTCFQQVFQFDSELLFFSVINIMLNLYMHNNATTVNTMRKSPYVN